MTSEPTRFRNRAIPASAHWKDDPPHDVDEFCDDCIVPFTETIAARTAAERDVAALVSAAKAVIDTFYGVESWYYGHEMAALRDALNALVDPAAAEPAPDLVAQGWAMAQRLSDAPRAVPAVIEDDDSDLAEPPSPEIWKDLPASRWPRWPSGPDAERELAAALLHEWGHLLRMTDYNEDAGGAARAILAALQEKRDPGE